MSSPTSSRSGESPPTEPVSAAVAPDRTAPTMIAAYASVGIGFVSALIHLSTGAHARAVFTTAVGLAFLPPAILLHSRRKWTPVLGHGLIATMTVLLAASHLLFPSPTALKLPLGFVALPVAAVMWTGHPGGIVWTFASAAMLGFVTIDGLAHLLVQALDVTERKRAEDRQAGLLQARLEQQEGEL